MNRFIKISIGLVLLIAFSNVQAIPLYRFTIDRVDKPESLLGQFIIKKSVMPGVITEDDIHNFKFISGSLQNFDYSIWNYFGNSLQFKALLQEDGSVVPGGDSEFYVNAYPPYEVVNGIIDMDIDFGYIFGDDGLNGQGDVICHSSDEADIRCDGGQEDSTAYVTFSFTSIQNVPEPSFGFVAPLAMVGLIFALRRRSKPAEVRI